MVKAMWMNRIGWTMSMLIGANVLFFCVLGLYQRSSAQSVRQPFSNAVEQRAEMIEQLKELNTLFREQNRLLRSGKIQVVVIDAKKK